MPASGAHAPDSIEVGGSGLLFHAGDLESDHGRAVALPLALTVKSEWGEVVCSAAQPCTEFKTPPLAVGQSVLYWLGMSDE